MTYGLTPRFSPPPGVLDLYNGEWIVERMHGERYLIGKRQEIIIVIKDLCGHRIVLYEDISGRIFATATIPVP